MSIRLILGSVALSLSSTSPLLAKDDPKPANEISADQASASAKPSLITGSRLAKKRFCGTRAEWADKRLQDRQAIERIQTSPCVLQPSGGSGRPSC
jgi:hypothetical protein